MSCVLRFTSPALSEDLACISIRPYRIDKGHAHFSVSQCDLDDLPGQVRDALVFLDANAKDLAVLSHSSESNGVLDFAVEAKSAGFQFLAFPPVLVRQAGALGLGLELSLYPDQSS